MLLKKIQGKLQRFRKTNLFITSFWNGIATMIKMATGLVSNKIVAVYLGPSGVALLGQFSNFTTIANSLAGMGMGTGITKYIAEYHDDSKARKQILSTGLKIILLSTIITSIVILFGAKYFCNAILKTDKYISIFYIFAATIFLFTINGFLIAVLNGHKEFKKIITINILSSFIGLAIVIPLVIKYGVYGALLGVILSTALFAFITFKFVINCNWFKFSNFTTAFHFPSFKKLSKYTLMAFTTLFAVTYIQLTIRTYIINNLSINDAGYWQGIIKISNVYLSVITTTLSLYYLPRLSEIKDKLELRNEIFKGYKFLLPLTIISSLIIYLFRGYIIYILFTPSFHPMKQLFLFQFIGDVFKISSWLLGFIMLAKAMTKTFIITEITFGLLFYVLTILFLKQYGVVGVTYAYCLNYALYLIVMVIIFRKILFLK